MDISNGFDSDFAKILKEWGIFPDEVREKSKANIEVETRAHGNYKDKILKYAEARNIRETTGQNIYVEDSYHFYSHEGKSLRHRIVHFLEDDRRKCFIDMKTPVEDVEGTHFVEHYLALSLERNQQVSQSKRQTPLFVVRGFRQEIIFPSPEIKAPITWCIDRIAGIEPGSEWAYFTEIEKLVPKESGPDLINETYWHLCRLAREVGIPESALTQETYPQMMCKLQSLEDLAKR